MGVFEIFFGRDSSPSNLHEFLKTVVCDGSTREFGKRLLICRGGFLVVPSFRGAGSNARWLLPASEGLAGDVLMKNLKFLARRQRF